MHRIDCPTATPDHRFTEGNPTIPVMATVVTADWLNSVQEEICSVLSAAKIELDKSAEDQLLKAIKVVIDKTVPLATLALPGLVKPDGATLSIKPDGTIYVTQGNIYHIGEVYHFLHPDLRPGFVPCYGGLLTDVDQMYPEAWEYFQTEHGQKMCCTEAEWQAMTHAVWHTNADGSQVGWNGIGGAPKFVLNITEKSLRMPDLRGMVEECTGGPDSPGVGHGAGDGIRDIHGYLGVHRNMFTSGSGVFSMDAFGNITTGNQGETGYGGSFFHAYNVVPVFSVNRMRTWGSLVCAYLGQPGS